MSVDRMGVCRDIIVFGDCQRSGLMKNQVRTRTIEGLEDRIVIRQWSGKFKKYITIEIPWDEFALWVIHESRSKRINPQKSQVTH